MINNLFSRDLQQKLGQNAEASSSPVENISNFRIKKYKLNSLKRHIMMTQFSELKQQK